MIPTNSLIAGQQQGRLVNWVIRHQVDLFFAFTFLFSWSILAVIAPFEDSTTYRRIVAIAGFGPSLAAIILSTITNTEPTRKVSFRREALFISILVLLAGIEWHNNIW